MVMLDNATTRQGENFGGLVAAPVFSSIAGKAMKYLGVEPTEPITTPHSEEATLPAQTERD